MLVVVVLVAGLVGSALAAPTIGRLSGEERRERLAQSLGILGALVAGFGVILFFAANWGDIPRPLRVLLLLTGLVAFYAAGFALREVYGRRHIGHAFLFLGTVLFGAAVFLVGQMYHVEAHDPFGFLLWALGALAIALVVRSGPIAAVGFGSLFAWMTHEAADAADNALVDLFAVVPAYMTLYGIALYAAGTAAARWLEPRRFARPMRYLGFALLALGLLPFTFRDAYSFGQFDRALEIDRIAVIFAALVVAAGAGVAALAVLRWRDRRLSLVEAAALAGIVALVLAAMLAPEVTREEFGRSPLDRDATTYPLLFNLGVGLVAFGAVVVGMVTGEVWLANAGAALVGIDVLLRFFDNEWSMLERGVVFMLVGAAALAAAFLFERRRLRARPT